MPENYMQAYADAMAQANAANESRYQTIMAGYDDRLGRFGSTTKTINKGYDSLIARQERIGDSQRLDLQDQYGRALGNMRMSMTSRGLGNSTLYDSARRGVDYDLSRSKIALNDSLAREYAGVYGQKLGFMERANLFGTAGLRKEKLDFMERKQELGPQAELYARLAELAGQGAGGYAMGGGYTAGPMGGGGGSYSVSSTPGAGHGNGRGVIPGHGAQTTISGQFGSATITSNLPSNPNRYNEAIGSLNMEPTTYEIKGQGPAGDSLARMLLQRATSPGGHMDGAPQQGPAVVSGPNASWDIQNMNMRSAASQAQMWRQYTDQFNLPPQTPYTGPQGRAGSSGYGSFGGYGTGALGGAFGGGSIGSTLGSYFD